MQREDRSRRSQATRHRPRGIRDLSVDDDAVDASYEILDRYTDGTWFAGGCGILAAAVLQILGGRGTLLALCSDKGIEHLAVEIDLRKAAHGYRDVAGTISHAVMPLSS